MSELIRPIQPVITGRPSAPAAKPGTASSTQPEKTFRELLDASLRPQPQTLTFSKHAQARTVERNITLSRSDLDKLDAAAEKAGQKGLTDTLIFMNNRAFVVNVPSKVVVTVVDRSDTEPTVFTNIDGAVMV